ncbi:hypothetical protein, partial [Acinetobacter pittii]|uniref:hypothetical protein n=1 Tax=Acinetobacter pittii TaxID=48296 RepID=UPI00355C2B52
KSQQVISIFLKLISQTNLPSNSSLKAINLITSNCFSTSFHLHHRRWMCIIDHLIPFAIPFLILAQQQFAF